MKRLAFFIVLGLAICLTAGAYCDEYTIQAGDMVSVTVLGEADLTKQYTVDQDGNITMPLVQQVHVGGLTTAQAREAILEKLKEMIKNPQVSIDKVEPGKIQVTVSGEVKAPGIIQLASGSKLVDAITAAGGYTPNADLTKVSISSAGSTEPSAAVDLSKFLLGGDTSANVPVSAGDTIHVPTKETNIIGNVSVLGAVRQAGSHPITQGMTLREAIMLAGGPTEFADTSNVSIRHEGETASTAIDYAKALTGDPVSNILLKPGDTIYVGSSQQLGFYTIQGGVAAPGRYEIKGDTSITEAIAIAGGVRGKAKLNDVSILRSAGETQQTVKLKVADIMAGKVPNVKVQNGDSIIVPANTDKPDYFKMASLAISIAWLLLGHR